MKKRWIFPSLCIVMLLAAIFFRTSDRPVEVSAITLEPSRVEQTISCMGIVEASDTTAVALPITCVIRQVNVKSGDRVKKGEVLALVDKEATGKTLFSTSELMTLAAIGDEITAPCDGTVIEVCADQQALEYGTPCALLAADDNLQIRVAIRERELRSVKQGMTVRITGDGFDRPFYEGELIKISSTARTNEGGTVVEGLVTLADGAFDPSLRLGLTAKAAIVTSVTENGYIIPYEAVLTDKSGSYVYVLENGQAQRQGIKVAAQVAEGILLEDDDIVSKQIIANAESVSSDGQKVTVRGSDA